MSRREVPPNSLELPPLNRLNLGGATMLSHDKGSLTPGHKTPSLKLDTTPSTLSSGMVSPFSENPHGLQTAPVQASTAPPALPDTANSAVSPMEPSSIASPAASSLMDGIASDMQARILAIQQQRSGRRGTNSLSAKPQLQSNGKPNGMLLSRTPSTASGSWRHPSNVSSNGQINAALADKTCDSRRSSGQSFGANPSPRTSVHGWQVPESAGSLGSARGSASSLRGSSDTSMSTSTESLDFSSRRTSAAEDMESSHTSPSQAQSQSQSQSQSQTQSQTQLQSHSQSQLQSTNAQPATSPKPLRGDSPAGVLSPTSPQKFDPSKHISSAGASMSIGGALALGRTPSVRSRQRSSLSERRGMKLDTSALESPLPGGTRSATVPRGPGPPPGGFQALRQAPRAPNRPNNIMPSQPKGGLFANYKRYIDIDTGRLNFQGKASLHAKGIDFSSGTSFNISLDQLEPICELGSGNYGTVNKVLHKPTNVIMAMKEVRLELDENAFHQIIMELDVLHRCSMANIVEFYGAFFVEGAVYICMEYMDGGSMTNIYRGGIPEPYLKFTVHSVVEGLRQLKEDYNIIHRDVKPTNILSSTSGKVKLCDFGVSGNLVASIARTNIGCQAYMAPERIRGSGPNGLANLANGMQNNTYTIESDVWSLGLSIIEMSEGEYPYPPETYSNVFSQLTAIVDGDPPSLDPTKYSPEAVEFVSQLLAKDPSKRPRYADMLEHPWLKNQDYTKIDMGAFVTERKRLVELDSTPVPSSTPTPVAL